MQDIVIVVAYIPPSAPDGIVDDVIQQASTLSNGFELRCIIVGDLNARIGDATGDTATNTRGTVLLQALATTPLRVQKPTTGKWTSFSNGGHGIPDIVLANFPVSNFVVHESESLGGSDHRPLTFDVPTEPLPPKTFERWNIRRLARATTQEQYRSHLEDTEAAIATSLAGLPHNTPAVGPAHENAAMQQAIDDAWQTILQWINNAAAATIGKFEMTDRIPTEFWTEALERERDALCAHQSTLQEAIKAGRLPPLQIKAMAAQATEAAKAYRGSTSERRRVLFEDAVDNIATPQNYGAFMRMVKGAKSRSDRTGCKLDPERINEHAQHFRTTFGAAPTGNADLPRTPAQQQPLQSRPTDIL
ncbi:hypothetical protein HDU83_008171, partial [Entophlyctis luteolus]